MATDSATTAAPIGSIDDLARHIEAGCKPDTDLWRIGSEHEKFVFHRSDYSPLSYDGDGDKPGIRHILQGFVDRGWTAVEEKGQLIATKKDGASVTLEPAGQFELSGAPLENIHQTCDETTEHLYAVKELGEQYDIGFLGLGYHPQMRREEARVMPKGRYNIMRSYMPKVGNLGLDMMLRTCTVQVNLDYGSEADMVEKMRISLALQPLATALFANSPFKEGALSPYKSLRSHTWTDTDPDRTGMLPFVFEDGFSFERYVDYVLDVPMYFVSRGGKYIDASGQSFRDFMAGKLPALPGELPTMADFDDHLTTLFPEVRMKTFIEMRGADGGPWSRLCALPAFWVGLLYDSQAQNEAYALIKDWTEEERQTLRDTVCRDGLQTTFRGRTVSDWAHDVLKISDGGLKRRNRLSVNNRTEQHYLDSLFESIETGEAPADELIRRWKGEWGQDFGMMFDAMSY